MLEKNDKNDNLTIIILLHKIFDSKDDFYETIFLETLPKLYCKKKALPRYLEN